LVTSLLIGACTGVLVGCTGVVGVLEIGLYQETSAQALFCASYAVLVIFLPVKSVYA
jgi:hypothetical protein